jgi:hypothetical protein
MCVYMFWQTADTLIVFFAHTTFNLRYRNSFKNPEFGISSITSSIPDIIFKINLYNLPLKLALILFFINTLIYPLNDKILTMFVCS